LQIKEIVSIIGATNYGIFQSSQPHTYCSIAKTCSRTGFPQSRCYSIRSARTSNSLLALTLDACNKDSAGLYFPHP